MVRLSDFTKEHTREIVNLIKGGCDAFVYYDEEQQKIIVIPQKDYSPELILLAEVTPSLLDTYVEQVIDAGLIENEEDIEAIENCEYEAVEIIERNNLDEDLVDWADEVITEDIERKLEIMEN